MLRKEKVNFISEELNKLYPKTPTPLTHQNKFELLIAVLLSAQCTDERVNKISPLLFKVANNPFEMEKISKEKIYSIIKPCGLGPQKSKAISELSKILVKEFNGNIPRTFKELEKLPGVGHKTASVVMSQGFGFPAFPVDTHIHRLAQRWGLTNGRSVNQTEKDLKSCSLKRAGINYIFKLFFMEESIVLPEDVWALNVIYAGHCIQKGLNP